MNLKNKTRAGARTAVRRRLPPAAAVSVPVLIFFLVRPSKLFTQVCIRARVAVRRNIVRGSVRSVTKKKRDKTLCTRLQRRPARRARKRVESFDVIPSAVRKHESLRFRMVSRFTFCCSHLPARVSTDSRALRHYRQTHTFGRSIDPGAHVAAKKKQKKIVSFAMSSAE